MARTKGVAQAVAVEPATGELKWRKIGGAPIILNNRYIKPNQTFFAKKEDLPKQFLDLFECLSEEGLVKEVTKAEALHVKKIKYTIEEDNDTNEAIHTKIAELAELDLKDPATEITLRKIFEEAGLQDADAAPIKALKKTYIREAKEGLRYNIVDKFKKSLNETPVSFEEAEKLLQAIE